MKQISNYFPFFILTILLYGFFFYHHKQSTIINPVPFNSGQQAVQLQFVDVTEEISKSQAETETTKKEVETEVETEANTETAKKKVEKQQSESVEITTTVEKKKVIEKPVKTLSATVNSKSPAEIKTANQKLQKTIQETTAESDAMLKAEVFEADFHLDLAAAQTAKKSPQKAPTTKTKKVKTILTAESVSSEILQQQAKAKRVFKKQPQTSSASVMNQGVLQEAIVVSGNKPTYPERARKRNQEGRVVVKLTVTTKGKAKNPEIISSSGYSMLDNAALQFISEELFMPAHKGDEKITTEQLFSFRFQLE